MDVAGYVSLTRISSLDKELQAVANNIANVATTGFQREGVIFSEMIQTLPTEGGSVAMSGARGRFTDQLQGALVPTDGTLDFAIEGKGYFTVLTPQGERLTRSGAFTRDSIGQIATLDGFPLLDEGGAPILVPFEAENIVVGQDGTISIDGTPAGKIGIVDAEDPTKVFREAGTMFRVEGGVVPVDVSEGEIVQGFVEQSNVNPISEMSRMIAVQRAYEFSQKMMDREDERIKSAIQTISKIS